MKPRVTLRKALSDKNLLGAVLPGDSWRSWRVLLIAANGEKLSDNERALFTQLTGREHEPSQRVEEFVGVVGRRGGKSRAISVIATYIAGLCTHPALVPGERGVLLIIAPDRKQAAVVLNYIEAAFRTSPILKQLIEARTAGTLRLRNRIDVEVRASDFRTVRGPTYIAVIADEAAFWMNDESANPDSEILNACRPGLATTRGPMFIISSPYARRGELWSLYRKHFGPTGDNLILVAQGASRTFNPSLPQSVVDRAMERDPASAAAEYGAQFRTDVESFISREVVDACVVNGRHELPRIEGCRYVAFVDPSGGSSDSMTMAIAHAEGTRIVLDVVRERKPPFSPDDVVADFSQLFKAYGLTKCRGDRYGGMWPRERFSVHGIEYLTSDKAKSDIYREMLPLLNGSRAELLDLPRLITQLTALERHTARGGRDSIDHAPGTHDDLINAAAGALVLSARVNVQKVPMVVAPDLSKGSQDTPNLRGVPSQYLKQGQEPWGKFVSVDGTISTRGDRWGPT